MKKLLFFLFWATLSVAQTPCNPLLVPGTTPNLGLSLPQVQGCNWGPELNSNFSALDTLLGSGTLLPGPGGGGNPNGALDGDISRFNVKGDNNWDAASAGILSFMVVADASGGSDSFTCWGMFASQCVNDTKNSFSNVSPTTSSSWGRTLTSAATGSTSTVIGLHAIENGGNSLAGLLSFYKASFKIQINNTTNARWWIGMCVFNSGSSLGVNSSQCDGTTAYASNLPNKTTMGFRLSGGTDSTWQCVSIVAGVSSPTSTVVDTTIVPDTTAPHSFDIAVNRAGTSMYCLIDGVVKATITTPFVTPATSADTYGSPFFTGDNENTATSISAVFYSAKIAFK